MQKTADAAVSLLLVVKDLLVVDLVVVVGSNHAVAEVVVEIAVAEVVAEMVAEMVAEVVVMVVVMVVEPVVGVLVVNM